MDLFVERTFRLALSIVLKASTGDSPLYLSLPFAGSTYKSAPSKGDVTQNVATKRETLSKGTFLYTTALRLLSLTTELRPPHLEWLLHACIAQAIE
jgi:hypothetical protein